MKSRIVRRFVVCGIAATALALGACSSRTDSAESTETATAASTSIAAAGVPPLPTAAELNARLAMGLDPNVPVTEKVKWVQGSEADPALFETMTSVYTKEGATINITGVSDLGGGRMEATGDFTLWGEVHPQVVPFVAEDGEWKVEKTYACGVVQFAQLTSPACS